MLKGLHLTLMIGPAVPVPVPQAVLDALTGVEVVTAGGETASGFTLTFAVGARSPLQTLFLLAGGASVPLVRVVLVATVNGVPEVLIDGVMTNHQYSAGADGKGTLRVMGKDLTAVMDYQEFSGLPYPAMTVDVRVLLILAKYAVLGVIPLVIPSILVDVPIPTERIPRHQGTDLAYVRLLAHEVGYVFYLTPGPAPGTSFAYWGPEVRVGIPQPALNTGEMDAHANVDALSFTFNGESAALPIVFVHEPITKAPIPIPIPDISLLNPPLGLIPPIPKQLRFIKDTAKFSPLRAALFGLGEASRANEAVSATGSLDVLRYGRVLKARGLVGVRGAGEAFDGLYYVKSVTHTLKRGEYKQSFTLTRNGLVSTVSAVPV